MRTLEEILNNEKIWNYSQVLATNGAYIKLPDCGTCSVVWNNCEHGYEHVSVSPRKRFNIPSWNDMCVLKDVFWGEEEEVYQIHPKKSEYVNVIDNCLHLWKPIGHELNELVQEGEEKMQKKEKYETCKHAESVGNMAVCVKPTCPQLPMIKGALVTSKSRCRKCRSWEEKEDGR